MDLTVIPDASRANGRDVGSGPAVMSSGESVLATLQCCGEGRFGISDGLDPLASVVSCVGLGPIGRAVCSGMGGSGGVGCPGVGGSAGGYGNLSIWYGGTRSTFLVSDRMPTRIGKIQNSWRPA